MKQVVIVGGGFGGVETFKQLHKYIHKGQMNVTLIDKNNYFLFTPMLHEVATGSISRTHLTLPLRQLADCCGRRFVKGVVKKIDTARKVVVTDHGEHSYDTCVIAVGSRSYDFGIPGATDHAFPLKTLPDCTRIRNRIVSCFEQASQEQSAKKRKELLHFVIVGGGPTGVELAGQLGELFGREMKKLYPGVKRGESRITLIESGEKVLSKHSDYFGTQAGRKLRALGVNLITSNKVVEVTARSVKLKAGGSLDAHTTIWTSGVQSNADKIMSRKDLDPRARIVVNGFLQCKKEEDVFSIGDCAIIDDASVGFVPSTAQAAVQQARIVSGNIVAAMRKKKLSVFSYASKGDLIPVGEWFAVAQLGPLRFKGRFAWWLRRTVFLLTMYSWSDRLRIALDWTLNIFTLRDTSEL